jgi:hypothetical protein
VTPADTAGSVCSGLLRSSEDICLLSEALRASPNASPRGTKCVTAENLLRKQAPERPRRLMHIVIKLVRLVLITAVDQKHS